METRLDHNTYLDHALSDGHALLTACATAPTAQLSACPDWHNTDLVQHLVDVWNFFVAQVEAQNPETLTKPLGDPEEPASDLLERAIKLIRSTEPETPAWNWTMDRQVSWFARRLAHETSIHLWDAQEAIGFTNPIESHLAVAGICEFIAVAFRYSLRDNSRIFPAGSLHLHQTDGDGEWLLTTDTKGNLIAKNEHAKGDAAARGSASDLILFMWGRGRGELEWFGEETLLEAWSSMGP